MNPALHLWTLTRVLSFSVLAGIGFRVKAMCADPSANAASTSQIRLPSASAFPSAAEATTAHDSPRVYLPASAGFRRRRRRAHCSLPGERRREEREREGAHHFRWTVTRSRQFSEPASRNRTGGASAKRSYNIPLGIPATGSVSTRTILINRSLTYARLVGLSH